MPELPEVEAARRAIEEHCLGKIIKRAVIANDSKVIDGLLPSDFEASLLGKTIVSANRKGKNMWLRLNSPPFPSFHFGMAGAIYIKGVAVTQYKRSAVNDTDEWPSKYSKFFIELEDGLELSFTDKRRFAKVRLLSDPALLPPISELGPDVLFEPMTVDAFTESLSKKKTGIKALLLDQGYIAGIGNWIADEVLYQAKIHPLQIAASLSKESCEALHKSIEEVIEKALEVGADTSQFPSNWIFHSREKKPGKAIVDGKKIDFITAGGRTTAYVPELQKLSGGSGKEVGKPKRGSSKETSEPKKVPKGSGRNRIPKAGSKTKSIENDDVEVGNGDINVENDGNGVAGKKRGRKMAANDKAKVKKTAKIDEIRIGESKSKSIENDDDEVGNRDINDGNDGNDAAGKKRGRKMTANEQGKFEKTSKIYKSIENDEDEVGAKDIDDENDGNGAAGKKRGRKMAANEKGKVEKTTKTSVELGETRKPRRKGM